MSYISRLDSGGVIWEVLGVGQIVESRSRASFDAIFYFCSVADFKSRGWSGLGMYLRLPIESIRTLVPGSLWQHGRKISPHTYGGHWVDLSDYEATNIDAVHHLQPEGVVQRLINAKCPRSEFLCHINYIKFEGLHARVIIPCSELFRSYLCPSRLYANFALTSEFQSWLPSIFHGERILMPSGRAKFNGKEISVTTFLSSTASSVASGLFPFKNLQATNLNNYLLTSRKNMLLKFVMPFDRHVRLRVTGQTINPARYDKCQLHSLVVEKIHESAHALLQRNSDK